MKTGNVSARWAGRAARLAPVPGAPLAPPTARARARTEDPAGSTQVNTQ